MEANSLSEPQEIIHDPLTLALTKPVVKWGVPIEYFMINMMICVMTFLATEYLSSYLLAIPIHILGLLVSQTDHHIFNVYRVSLQKTTFIFKDMKIQIPFYLAQKPTLKAGVKSEFKELKNMAQNHELPDYIPYTRFASEDGSVIKLNTDTYMSVLKLDGLFFQTKDIEEINARHLTLETLIRSLNSSEYALYTHIIRRKVKPTLSSDFANTFASGFDKSYFANLNQRQLFTNDIYISILKRPLQGKVGGVQSMFSALNDKLNAAFNKNHISLQKRLETEACKDLIDQVHKFKETLNSYGSEILSHYIEKHENGAISKRNKILEFLVLIGNGVFPTSVNVPNAPLNHVVATKNIEFGTKFLKFIGSTKSDSKYAALLSLREYSSFTAPGLLNPILKIPHELILTQSYGLRDRRDMQGAIEQRQRQTADSDAQDSALEDDIANAKDDLVSSKSIFGQHHTTVLCLGKDIAEVERNLTMTTTVFTNSGMQTTAETTALRTSFFASYPGNFSYICRPSFISSQNLCGLSSLHNYPIGERTKLHWKSPITVLETTSLTPYYFNFHKNDLGHISLLGASGTGKTVLQLMLAVQSQRLSPAPRLVFFDKDQGCRICIEAMGGEYEVLEKGTPTGLNPLLLKNTNSNREFLVTLFQHILKPTDDGRLKTAEIQHLRQAIEEILKADIEGKTLANLKMLLAGKRIAADDDLSARLTSWIDERQDGWLFGGAPTDLNMNQHIIGYDMTTILDDHKLRTAILMFLFHKIEEMLKGEPIIIFLDEAWKLLQDEAFSAFIMDKLKTLRKLNGIIVFTTQSASDIVTSSISATLIEQTATNIFFPNLKAHKDHYQIPFGLSEREYNWVKTTSPDSRQFLIKQADNSVIAKLNLAQMPDYLKVFSGRVETVQEMIDLQKKYGHDPKKWLPHFANQKMEV